MITLRLPQDAVCRERPGMLQEMADI